MLEADQTICYFGSNLANGERIPINKMELGISCQEMAILYPVPNTEGKCCGKSVSREGSSKCIFN